MFGYPLMMESLNSSAPECFSAFVIISWETRYRTVSISGVQALLESNHSEVNFQAAVTSGTVQIRLQCRLQTKVAQHCRVQSVRHVSHILVSAADLFLNFPNFIYNVRVLRWNVLADVLKSVIDACQSLARLVVQLPSNPPAFLLLRVEQSGGQLLELFPVLMNRLEQK